MGADFKRKAVCRHKRGLYYGGVCTEQKIFILHFVSIRVQYLIRKVMVLKERPLFHVGVYVSKGGCVPINLLKISS